MKRITFIHAADLHLDSPMIGLKHLPQRIFRKLQESTFEALTKIVDAAIKRKADFVILAGDLFDGEDRSIRAQVRFRKEMERLAEKDIPVFAVHGNHDHMEGNWTHLKMPDNVHIFSHEVEMIKYMSKEGISVHLYGFSYPKRHVHERMIDSYSKVQGADFHIGILHGHFEGNSDHGKYAPFKLKDLLEKGFDYWALGHIHKRDILCEQPPIIYPGNIQGRNKKESGGKGCYVVQLAESGATLEFIESASVIWEEKTVDASNEQTFDDLFHLCKRTLEESRLEHIGTILSLTLDHVDIPSQDFKSIVNGELLEALQEEEKEESSFVWLSEINTNEKKEWSKDSLAKESDFYSELFKTAKQHEILEESLVSLYEHPLGRKYIEALQENEKKELLSEAEELLVNLLYHVPKT